MLNLREQLDKVRGTSGMSVRDSLLKLKTANSTEPILSEDKNESLNDTDDEPVTFDIPGAEKPTKVPVKKLEESFIGTNYDPYDPDQTKPEPDGIGKALIKLDESMVATSLKDDGETGNLRLGTVIRIPALGNKVFLVADTMNKRFNGMNKIDFVAPNKKKEPDPTLNQTFEGIEVLREGSGAKDAREFVESGEWEKMKKEYEETE